jgi:thioester reductase-like protein
MLELTQKYSDFGARVRPQKVPSATKLTNKVVVLTGTTGALGAHILYNLHPAPSISLILCLVREADGEASRSRVLKSLGQRKLSALDVCDDGVLCVPCRLNEKDLGLTPDVVQLICQRATHFIHVSITFLRRHC